MKILSPLVGALAGSVFAVSAMAQTTLMTDNMDGLDGSAALMGNDWLFVKAYYTDTGCSAGEGYYSYTGVNPEPARNTNYNTVKPAGGGVGTLYDAYSNQGVEGGLNVITGTASIAVREDNYSSYVGKDPCHRSMTFKDYSSTTLKSGTYRIKAKAAFNRYGGDTENPSGTKTGVFLRVFDKGNGYATLLEEYRVNTVTRAGDVLSVDETFNVDLGISSDIMVRAGFYAQAGASQSVMALWDDFELSYTPRDGSSGDVTFGEPSRIPTLPLGGLLALIGLMGWLGLRRK